MIEKELGNEIIDLYGFISYSVADSIYNPHKLPNNYLANPTKSPINEDISSLLI